MSGFSFEGMPDMGDFNPGDFDMSQMPDMGDFNPEDMPGGGDFNPGNMPGGFGGFGGGPGEGSFPGQGGVSFNTETMMIYGVCLGVMLIGIVAVGLFRRRRYVKPA